MYKNILLFVFSILTLSTYAQEMLPDIELKNLDGKVVSINEMSKDKLIVIDFWATWCVPCINELDAIAEEYVDLQDEMDFELIAVSVDDARTKSRVKPMVNGKGWEYEILLDDNQALKRAMNVANPPVTFIVKDGKILYSHTGYTPGSEQELFEKFRSFQ